MSGQHGTVLSFGPFELSIGNRLLTNGAKVVPLGARAMDLLIVLVEQANKVVPALIDRLQERPTLIILDCCEHLIDGASAVAEELICRVPTLHLLATSREAMRVEGEHVFELCALACPPEDSS